MSPDWLFFERSGIGGWDGTHRTSLRPEAVGMTAYAGDDTRSNGSTVFVEKNPSLEQKMKSCDNLT